MKSSSSAPIKADLDLDLRGLKCPLPALKAQAALSRLVIGQILKVTTTDPLAVLDIPHLAQQRGDALLDVEEQGEATVFLIRKQHRP